MDTARSNLSVPDSIFQGRNVALAILIISDRHGAAIAQQKHRMALPRRNFGIRETLPQFRDVALTNNIAAATHRAATAP